MDMQPGDTCTGCGRGTLELVLAEEVWLPDRLPCNCCGCDFNLD